MYDRVGENSQKCHGYDFLLGKQCMLNVLESSILELLRERPEHNASVFSVTEAQ